MLLVTKHTYGHLWARYVPQLNGARETLFRFVVHKNKTLK